MDIYKILIREGTRSNNRKRRLLVGEIPSIWGELEIWNNGLRVEYKSL